MTVRELGARARSGGHPARRPAPASSRRRRLGRRGRGVLAAPGPPGEACRLRARRRPAVVGDRSGRGRSDRAHAPDGGRLRGGRHVHGRRRANSTGRGRRRPGVGRAESSGPLRTRRQRRECDQRALRRCALAPQLRTVALKCVTSTRFRESAYRRCWAGSMAAGPGTSSVLHAARPREAAGAGATVASWPYPGSSSATVGSWTSTAGSRRSSRSCTGSPRAGSTRLPCSGMRAGRRSRSGRSPCSTSDPSVPRIHRPGRSTVGGWRRRS